MKILLILLIILSFAFSTVKLYRTNLMILRTRGEREEQIKLSSKEKIESLEKIFSAVVSTLIIFVIYSVAISLTLLFIHLF